VATKVCEQQHQFLALASRSPVISNEPRSIGAIIGRTVQDLAFSSELIIFLLLQLTRPDAWLASPPPLFKFHPPRELAINFLPTVGLECDATYFV